LDCCFSILPNNIILYSKKYISSLPSFCYRNFNCINVDDIIVGDTNLSTNFLFLDKNTILTDNQYRFKNVRKLLKRLDFEIIIVDLKKM
jgi:N-dimethylarginine dimethylaminohydrolase